MDRHEPTDFLVLRLMFSLAVRSVYINENIIDFGLAVVLESCCSRNRIYGEMKYEFFIFEAGNIDLVTMTSFSFISDDSCTLYHFNCVDASQTHSCLFSH